VKNVLKTTDQISNRIIHIRGKNVMLDRDLAKLYGVPTSRLNEQVKRNIKRFPKDFMFHLTVEETTVLVSHSAIPSKKHLGGHLPNVFTEQGIAMLSGVLNSNQAIQVMRAFVSLRRMVITSEGLKRKIEAIEKKYDAQFKMVFTAIKQLISPAPSKKKRRIGFHKD